MMKFTLLIDLDNDAWHDDEAISLNAIGDALSDVRKALWSGCDSGKIYDTNGNKSGEWSVTA